MTTAPRRSVPFGRAVVLVSLLLAVPSQLTAQRIATLQGIVIDSLAGGRPLADAIVGLKGTDRYVSTDARGRFRLDSLSRGRYELTLQHDRLDSLDLALPPVVVDLTDSTNRVVQLGIPSATTLRRLLCPGDTWPDRGVVSGRVFGTFRADSARLRVSLRTSSGAFDDAPRERRDVPLPPSGGFIICEVPPGAIVGLQIVEPNDSTAELLVPLQPAGFTHSAVRIGSDTRVVRLTAQGPTGAPIVGARIRLVGRSATAVTDSTGIAILATREGTQTVLVTALGMDPLYRAVDVQTDTVLRIRMERAMVLPTVRTTETASADRLREFNRRRQEGFGVFLGPTELERVRGGDLTRILTSARGVTLGAPVRGRSMPYLRGFSAGRCIPNYFVDGVQFVVESVVPTIGRTRSFTDLEAQVPPELIEAIEIYPSPVGLPPEYDRSSSSGCGSILIWTKRK